MPPQTIIRGTFDRSDYESNIIKLDIRDEIFQFQPEAAPFMTVLSEMPKDGAHDMRIYWFEDDLIGNYSQINKTGGYGTGDTVLIVDNATIYQVGDVVKNTRTDECMLVTDYDDNANTITVKRAWGTTAAAAMNEDDYIYKLGSAQAEGYMVPEGAVTAKIEKNNYLQIMSKSVEITETAEAIATYGGNRRNSERKKKGIELLREIEAQFLWGEPKLDTSGGHPRYQTGGIYYFIKDNATTLDMGSAAITESAFEGFLKDVFAYDDGDRILFGSNLLISQISQFASGKQRLEPGTNKVYGISVRTYISAMGRVHLKFDRHFLGPHKDKGLCLKVEDMVYRYLDGNGINKDFKLGLDKQPRNAHYKQDEYEATIGCEIRHAAHHGIIEGVA